MSVTVKTELVIICPVVPDNLRYEGDVMDDNDSYYKRVVPIEVLSDSDLAKVADEWKIQLIARAQRLRADIANRAGVK